MGKFNIVLLLTVFTGSMTSDVSPPVVVIKDGTLKGTYFRSRNGNTIQAFLGVPYSIPPVGNRRFEPSKPNKPWHGVRAADKMPPACIQNRTFVGNQSEDCLYLNVFTPKRRVGKLPVMVWIHGGTFEANTISTFTPEYMLDEMVVLVCISYRLGLFGFMSTGDQVLPGNLGLKDQRLGLRWVKKNIKRFGGDPTKVTIFGQSAGAACVHALMSFAAKEGLFRAGICQSGVSLLPFSFHLPNKVEYMKQELAKLSNCPNDSVGFVNCLKEKPAEFILKLLTQYKETQKGVEGGASVALVLEPDCAKDRIITHNPWEVTLDLPLLTGVMSSEMLEFFAPIAEDPTDTSFVELEASYDTILPARLDYQYSSANGSGLPSATRSFYFQNRPISRATFPELIEMLTDAYFTYGTYEAILRSNVSKSFLYFFEYIGLNHNYPVLPPNETVGAAHEDDVFFFFPHPLSLYSGRNYSKEDDQLSRKLVKLWVNFATHLNPTPSQEELQWKPFGYNENFYIFGQHFDSLNMSFLPERMKFWKEQPYVIRDDNISPSSCS